MPGKNSNDIKTILADESSAIRTAHFAGASGSEIVQRRTALIDQVLRNAYAEASTADSLPTLVAIGGYGRGELNPYSDIDIMLLCRDEADRQHAPKLLYPLWDAGLDVGYSVRTMKECVSLCRQDGKIRTSLIESRLIAGDSCIYDSYLCTMQGEVFYQKPAAFIAEKVSERLATRRQFGGSIYLREPNIKEGEGGLRDFHTALWAVFTHYRVSSLGELVGKGIITDGQYAAFLRARNFLWRLRNEIHFLSGRKNDHLTFDLQERTAEDFHYRNSANLLAVERFMKAYFLHARNIREFTDMVLDAILRKPARHWFSRTVSLGSFKLAGKTLLLDAPNASAKDPALILSAFEIAQSRHAVFSDRLRSTIRECRIDDEARSSPEAAAIFLTILNNPDMLWETLTLMKDLKFLGRYIPEFRAVQAFAKHDYYHKYTVDEHILLAIRNLQNIWTGRFPANSTLFEAFKSIKKRWVLFLAVLLHDLGKIYRHEHEVKGVDLAENILSRLNVVGEDRDRILFLIKNHLVMTSLSQRRELTDQKVIASFCRTVRNRENLVMLYLLTFADISAVNPTAWTQWKAGLLSELYVRTLGALDTSAQAVEAARVRLSTASENIRKTAASLFTPEEIAAFLDSMSDQYIIYTSPHKVVDHMSMVKRLPGEQLVLQHRHYPERGYTELTICAYDAYGMFYRTAGTIATKNLSILRAQVYTSRNGVMIDTFQITGPEGKLYDYEPAWKSVMAELRKALANRSRPPQPRLFASDKVVPGTITAGVEFDNETSYTYTIIDITARDQVGFLYRITKALYDLNLDIGSAKIVTEGARIMDSFYVTDLLHLKITDSFRLEKIRALLLEIAES